jgi:EAL domain-containing protein (putative c-di-GMP-specific phosphodiesterase class I)
MSRKADDALIVGLIVDLGRNLGLSVVAEGIADAPDAADACRVPKRGRGIGLGVYAAGW